VEMDCDVRSCEDNSRSSTCVGWENECISDSLCDKDVSNEIAAEAG